MEAAQYRAHSTIETKLRERIAQLEDQLMFEKEIRKDCDKASFYASLRERFGFTPGQCELITLLMDAYPRVLPMGYLSDNLTARNSIDRNDKIIDVYLSRIRKSLRQYTSEPVFVSHWGGFRALTPYGMEFFRRMKNQGDSK